MRRLTRTQSFFRTGELANSIASLCGAIEHGAAVQRATQVADELRAAHTGVSGTAHARPYGRPPSDADWHSRPTQETAFIYSNYIP